MTSCFAGLEVVHKELIDFMMAILLIYSQLMLNIPVMWITGQLCGILPWLFFGDL
jgi:hypothetical protein